METAIKIFKTVLALVLVGIVIYLELILGTGYLLSTVGGALGGSLIYLIWDNEL